MSLYALLTAVRAQLNTDLVFPSTPTTKYLDIQLNGQPPANAGQEYISIHSTSWSFGNSRDQHMGLDELFGLAVTVTHRTGQIPDDKLLPGAFLGAQHGLAYSLEQRARQVLVSIHKNRYTIQQVANALTNTEGFIEPLLFADADPAPTPRGPDWFLSQSETHYDYGLSLELRFRPARRMQQHSTME